MKKVFSRIDGLLATQIRMLASVLAVIMALTVITAVRHESPKAHTAAANDGLNPDSGSSEDPSSVLGNKQTAAQKAAEAKKKAKQQTGEFGAKPGEFVPGKGTVPFGVHGDKITMVYYWKGDRTTTSPYLGKTGQSGAVDEGQAFRRLIAYINKYANGGKTFMGFPFNLHGRKIDINDPACPKVQGQPSCVMDAGQYPETYAYTAEVITKEIKPFAALSSHGSLSAYICPALAKAHIFNPVTYNLQANLYRDTNGWCLPQGIAWEKQVDLSVAWIAHQAKTTQVNAPTPRDRVYGILYAEYPGLKQEIPKIEKRLKAAGVNVALTQSVSPDLTKAGPAQKDVVNNFKAAGVNTIISPEGGSLITFTHAAASGGTKFDYYVWPCSGTDAAGQVRLYDPAQWQDASGLSCYDENWNLDLTLDANARASQWYKQYQEISGSGEDPPASTPLVYQGLLPILVGLTNAGPELTTEKFFAGTKAFKPYRYHGVTGPTTDPSHFKVTVGSDDGSQIGDVAEVKWNNAVKTDGNATPGAYVYSQKRYEAGATF